MPDSLSHKHLLFVAMPYGKRMEPGGSRTMDFDALYDECIKPAAADTDVDVIRADEDAMGGIVHKTMFERLLLAEIVIADLTFANANVFYELGIRHAARPRSTILICAKVGTLPFDIQPIRVLMYELDESGDLQPGEHERLRTGLAERLADALQEEGGPDSPPFQLVTGYPGIDLPRDTTDAFRARAADVSDLSVWVHEACRLTDRDAALHRLAALEETIRALRPPEEQLLTELLKAYRNVAAWDAMVDLVARMPARLQRAPLIRQQFALALNRRRGPGDGARAIDVIENLVDELGPSPESLGILGRCYKQRWLDQRASGDPGADAALDDAIEAYDRGFTTDPLDTYPAINLLTLLLARSDPADLEQFDEVVPFVRFALARADASKRRDYWTLATELEFAAVRGEERLATHALSRMLNVESFPWMRKSTADNLAVVADALDTVGRDGTWVRGLIARLVAGSR